MAIELEIPEDVRAIQKRVRAWVHDECIPAEKRLQDGEAFETVMGELRTKARAQGLWTPFAPPEYGGMGLGPLANAIVQMELGESPLGAYSLIDLIGRGATGNVYKARSKGGQIVALKVLNPDLMKKPEAVAGGGGH